MSFSWSRAIVVIILVPLILCSRNWLLLMSYSNILPDSRDVSPTQIELRERIIDGIRWLASIIGHSNLSHPVIYLISSGFTNRLNVATRFNTLFSFLTPSTNTSQGPEMPNDALAVNNPSEIFVCLYFDGTYIFLSLSQLDIYCAHINWAVVRSQKFNRKIVFPTAYGSMAINSCSAILQILCIRISHNTLISYSIICSRRGDEKTFGYLFVDYLRRCSAEFGPETRSVVNQYL